MNRGVDNVRRLRSCVGTDFLFRQYRKSFAKMQLFYRRAKNTKGYVQKQKHTRNKINCHSEPFALGALVLSIVEGAEVSKEDKEGIELEIGK